MKAVLAVIFMLLFFVYWFWILNGCIKDWQHNTEMRNLATIALLVISAIVVLSTCWSAIT